MTDETLKELWQIKDDIAKEHNYDLDSLVGYLRSKHTAGDAGVSRADRRKRRKPGIDSGFRSDKEIETIA